MNSDWNKLLNHQEETLVFGDLNILVKDKVFTPNPKITYSTSIIFDNFPDVKNKIVADVGTGTGILALTAKLKGAKKVVATDISKEAIENARINFNKNDFVGEIELRETSLLNGVDRKFDIVFANLPILIEVWANEPLSLIRKFIFDVKSKLNKNGQIYLPWGSFVEDLRQDLEKEIKSFGFEFEILETNKLGYLWYLYIIS